MFLNLSKHVVMLSTDVCDPISEQTSSSIFVDFKLRDIKFFVIPREINDLKPSKSM